MATPEDIRRGNVAMVCYAILGLSAVGLGAAMTFSEKETQAAWAFFLFANLTLPVLGALLTLLIYTVKARRYRALLKLSVVHVLFLAAIVLVTWRQSAPGASELPVDVAVLSYGMFFTAVSIWWFATRKRRMAKAES